MAEHSIVIWSDYLCPFCRLGQATAERLRGEIDADMTWLPFDLHPEYPPDGFPLEELHRSFGIGVGDDDPLRGRFESAGIEYNRSQVVPNTRAALRLAELAREAGLHPALHVRLMNAYWSEATDIGDREELRRIALDVGLDAADVARVLDDPDAYADVVEASTRQAHSIGVNAVPAFLLDQRLIVLGAQPLETFRRAFAQLAGA